MDEDERASMTVKSTIKPLGKRQIFTMKRANKEKRVNEYYNNTHDATNIIESIVAILVRNALVFSDFSFICQELVTNNYLTAEPNDVLRRFSSLFKPYFKKSGDWDAVVHRLFNNKKEYYQSSECYRSAVKYLYAVTTSQAEDCLDSYNLISIFKDANGRKHKWTLKDVDPQRKEEEIAVLLKLLTELTIFKNKEVRQFSQFMTFDCFKTTNVKHYEEPQNEKLEEPVEQSTEVDREELKIMVPHGFDPRTLSETELVVLVQAYLPKGKTIEDVHVLFVELSAEAQEMIDAQVSRQNTSNDYLEDSAGPGLLTKNLAVEEKAVLQEKIPRKKSSNNIGHLSGQQLSAMSLINRFKNRQTQTTSVGKSSKKTKSATGNNKRKKKRK